MDQRPGTVSFNVNAKLPESGNGGKAVCPLEKIGDFCQTVGNGAEHDSSVGNGFIAGNGKFSVK